MALNLVIPPTAEPVSLAEVKTALRIDGADEDAFLTGRIVAARQLAERMHGRAYVRQTWELSLDVWPRGREIRLPKPPLLGVESVIYTDQNGVEATFAPANYLVDARSFIPRIVLGYGENWPVVTLSPVNGVVVRFTAGYGGAADVPEFIKQAIYLLVGHWYVNREAVITGTISKEIEFAVTSLLGVDKVF